MSERVLITGDRFWDDDEAEAIVERELTSRDVVVVIHGCAKGIDTVADRVAKRLGIPVDRYPANWAKYGRAAGPIRNTEMLVLGEPDVVLAFHRDIKASKGTANMVKQAGKDGVPAEVFAA